MCHRLYYVRASEPASGFSKQADRRAVAAVLQYVCSETLWQACSPLPVLGEERGAITIEGSSCKFWGAQGTAVLPPLLFVM